jgi:riboflavin biosynthesis pyrimidine reductase
VSSIDGAATVGGETAALGGPADHHAFRALRGACDAILVGAGTVRIEGYGPAAGTPARRRDREDRGSRPGPAAGDRQRVARPRSSSSGLQRPRPPPLVVTHAAAPAAQVAARSDVAEVVIVRRDGGGRPRAAACAAGPWPATGSSAKGDRRLNGALLEADVVDELFLGAPW